MTTQAFKNLKARGYRFQRVPDTNLLKAPGISFGPVKATPFVVREEGSFAIVKYPGHTAYSGRGETKYYAGHYEIWNLGEGLCYAEVRDFGSKWKDAQITCGVLLDRLVATGSLEA